MGASQVDLYVTHLKPESRKFYNSKGNGLIDNIYQDDTGDDQYLQRYTNHIRKKI